MAFFIAERRVEKMLFCLIEAICDSKQQNFLKENTDVQKSGDVATLDVR